MSGGFPTANFHRSGGSRRAGMPPDSSNFHCTGETPVPPQVMKSGGFSLLEIIIVLVLMGIAVGLVAPAVMRSAGVGREQRAMGDLVTTLAARRLDAIRTGHVEEVVLRQSTDDLVIGMEEGERVVSDWPLVLSDEAASDAESVEIAFDARGRTAVDRVFFRSSRSPSRMWALVFDPVGGVPTAQRVTEATTQ